MKTYANRPPTKPNGISLRCKKCNKYTRARSSARTNVGHVCHRRCPEGHCSLYVEDGNFLTFVRICNGNPYTIPGVYCLFEGCDRPRSKGRFCEGHAKQRTRHQELRPLKFKCTWRGKAIR